MLSEGMADILVVWQEIYSQNVKRDKWVNGKALSDLVSKFAF